MTPKEKETYRENLLYNVPIVSEEFVTKLIETDEIEGNIPLPNVLLKPFLACVAILREYNVDAGKFVQFLLDKLSITDIYVVLSDLPLALPIDSGYNFHESIKDELYEIKEILFKRLLNSTDTASMIKEEIIECEFDKDLSKLLTGYRLVGYIRAKNPFVEETIREVFSTFCVTDEGNNPSGFRKGRPECFIDIDFLDSAAHDYNSFTVGYLYAMHEVFLKKVAAQIDEGISIKEIQRLEMFSDLPTAPPAPEATGTPAAGVPKIQWNGKPAELAFLVKFLIKKGWIEPEQNDHELGRAILNSFQLESRYRTKPDQMARHFMASADLQKDWPVSWNPYMITQMEKAVPHLKDNKKAPK